MILWSYDYNEKVQIRMHAGDDRSKTESVATRMSL